MIKKLLLILITGINLFCSAAFGQSLAEINTPRIVPPAPEAAALGKYGQVPVDKSNGIPNISIPLYDIKTSRFTIPISLSYNASGNKVDETATWVGTGWSLNAGGVITRTIINRADDMGGYLTTTLKTTAQIETTADLTYLENAAALLPGYDTQPDNFFYNFIDKTGAFVFGPDSLKTPVLTPFKPLKITFTQAHGSTPGFFTILDESGNIYTFNDTESVSNNGAPSAISSWYLSQMISVDRSDTVKFLYQTDTLGYSQYSYDFSQNLGPKLDANGCTESQNLWVMQKSLNGRTYIKPIYIKTILFKGGKVDFLAKSGRLDGMHFALDSVIVSNYDYGRKIYSRLKSFKLNTGYFYNNITLPAGNIFATGSKYRLKLDSLVENDKGNIGIKTHAFEYDPIVLPPVNFFAQDKWGYYNGKNLNQTLLEGQQIIGVGGNVFDIGGTDAGDRSTDTTYMKAGILEKITYPTKGYTVFTYEPHRFPGYSTYAPQKFVTASSEGYYEPTTTTSFTTDPSTTGGILTINMRQLNGVETQQPFVQLVNVSTGTAVWTQNGSASNAYNYNQSVSLLPNSQYELIASSPGGSSSTNSQDLPQASISIKYYISQSATNDTVSGAGLRIKCIKNYNSGGSLLNTETYKYGLTESGVGNLMNEGLALAANNYTRLFLNKYLVWNDELGEYQGVICSGTETVYSNNSFYALSTLSGSPVSYDAVTIYHGDNLNNIGKSRYEYDTYPDSLLLVDNKYQNGVKPIPVSWKNGESKHELYYRNNGSNQYLLQQEKYNYYDYFNPKQAFGVYIGYSFETINLNPWGLPYDLYLNYVFFDYPISSGSRVPSQSVTINYANDGVTKLNQDTVKYFYDNLNHVYPTRVMSYDGKGDSLLKTVKYPQDMVNAGLDPTGIYAAMVAANIISPVIQFTQSKNSTQLMQSVTTYASTSGIINPQKVSLQVMSNPAEFRLNYLSYDSNGNLTSVAKANGGPASYIWGYNGTYPVAEVKNASPSNIFFEGFEDGNGNTPDAKTGKYSHIGTYSKSLSGLSNMTYHLCYWQKSGTVWGLKDTLVTVSSGSFNISLNSQIDDIRFYPANALMTTYTYDPLIGVTSTTDAKEDISYYEYDSMQRLLNIRDQYKNIIKSFCYNYAGQATGCYIDLPSYKSAALSRTYNKNNCTAGYVGSAVTYTIPAGTFTSNISQQDANSQAAADTAAYGQNFANTNGTCIQLINYSLNNTTTVSSIQVTFTGASTYYFTMVPSANHVVQVPAGTYSVTVLDGAFNPHTYTLGTRTPAPYSPSATFSSVNVSTGSSDLTLKVN